MTLLGNRDEPGIALGTDRFVRFVPLRESLPYMFRKTRESVAAAVAAPSRMSVTLSYAALFVACLAILIVMASR
jgi:hypothetical protein